MSGTFRHRLRDFIKNRFTQIYRDLPGLIVYTLFQIYDSTEDPWIYRNTGLN